MKVFCKLPADVIESAIEEADDGFQDESTLTFRSENGMTAVEGRPIQVACMMEALAEAGHMLDEIFV